MIAFFDPQNIVQMVVFEGLDVRGIGTQAIFRDDKLEVRMVLAQLGNQALGGIAFTIIFAQFIAVCSSAKPCEIGENLLSVSDPISQRQERLIHVGALIRPPTLQRRPVSGLHPYAAVERSSPPMSPVPEPGCRSVGDVPLSPRV